jgi:hypothetical protein
VKNGRWIAAGVSSAALAVGTATGAGHAAASESPRTAHASHDAAAVAAAVRMAPATAVPSSAKLKLKEQYQTTTYYCVPAAGSMSLSTIGLSVGQKTLAHKMKTTQQGTRGVDATPVLNGYANPRGYAYTVVSDATGRPTTLLNRVSYDVGVLKKAPTIAVWMEKLPWNRGKVKGSRIGHAIVAYGYSSRTGTITVFDPWKATGGTHTISATALSATLQSGGMRFISRP